MANNQTQHAQHVPHYKERIKSYGVPALILFEAVLILTIPIWVPAILLSTGYTASIHFNFVLFFVLGFVVFFAAFELMYIEVEDCGQYLKVRNGPFSRFGPLFVDYSNIRSFNKADRTCCQCGCKRMRVASVPMGWALCKSDEVEINLLQPDSIQCTRYDKVLISVKDYAIIEALLQSKCTHISINQSTVLTVGQGEM